MKNDKQNRKGSIHALLAIGLVATIASTLLMGFLFAYSSNNHSTPSSLQVEIQPRDIKLYFGETQLFQTIVYNGTAPYNYKWFSNGTVIGSGITIEFGFETPCYCTILSVEVTDSLGNFGYDATFVYDPSSPDIYLDDLPIAAEYTIKTDATNYWAVRYDGKQFYDGTNAVTTIESTLSACSDGDTIAFGSGTFPITSQIDDQGKDYITIQGSGWGTNLVVPDQATHGWRIEDQTGWTFKNFKMTGTRCDDQGSSKFERAHFWFNDCSNMTIDYIWSLNANGYAIRLHEIAGNNNNENHVLNCRLEDFGHNGVGLTGGNSNVIESNWMWKQYCEDEMELIVVMGQNDTDTPYGAYHNKVLNNDLIGGQIAINFASGGWGVGQTPLKGTWCMYNIASGNHIKDEGYANGTASRIYSNAFNNRYEDNTITDENAGRTQALWQCIYATGAGQSVSYGNQLIGNSVYFSTSAVATGITFGFNMDVNSTIVMGNRVFGGSGSDAGLYSIRLHGSGSGQNVVVGNVVSNTIQVNGADNQEAHNVENANL